MKGEEGDEFVGFALGESGSDKRDAKDKYLEVREGWDSGGEGDDKEIKRCALLTTLIARHVRRERARWSCW